ncbi:NAD(P)H-dependent oxidoreductase [Apilactobacillus ozensis]|uniref:NAD(P)H-dependent oxidoreductase n=1 Tax=Apilactobacillus ozensis TaxID=866801 RepID=UPI0020932AB1|nr:NAD(P)H-dependent oxidoreductase [Apilactobacillus ozensis]
MVDLSQSDFNPVLQYGYRQHMSDETYPKRVQQLIQQADHLVFFFPVWWSAEPAILKGLIDRVFTPGFAYKYDKDSGKQIKLLKGKTADIFMSSHAPSLFYKLGLNLVFRWKKLVLGYCGIKVKNVLILGSMDKAKDTAQRRQTFIQKCINTIKIL